ncbi:MAG TPA: hypothetical protein VLA13_01050 [Massilibacterium sp.]|nr:hypothetical protein [Massilibacterium sp.]
MNEPFYVSLHRQNERGYVFPYTLLFIIIALIGFLFLIVQLYHDRAHFTAFFQHYQEVQLLNRFVLSTKTIPLKEGEEGTFQTNEGTIHYKVVEPYEENLWIIQLMIHLNESETTQKEIILPIKENKVDEVSFFNWFYGSGKNVSWASFRKNIIS